MTIVLRCVKCLSLIYNLWLAMYVDRDSRYIISVTDKTRRVEHKQVCTTGWCKGDEAKTQKRIQRKQ